MNIHSILAVTDLSPQGNRAVFRSAMLAAQHRALLKIMYAHQGFVASGGADVQSDIRQLAAEVHARFGVLVKNVADTSGHLQAIAEEARWVDMLVIGEHWQRSANGFFRGQPIERLQRRVPCPVLLARLDVFHRYRRVLVAVDFAPSSRKLVKFARSLCGDAQLELFHALNTTLGGRLRYRDISEEAMKACRHESLRDAQERLLSVSDSSTARRNRVAATIGKGDVARQAVIQQQHSNADLLVIGKRRCSGFSDFLFGSVARRVLWWSPGDVLLVPHDLRIDPKPEAAAPTGMRHGRRGMQDAVGRAA